MSDTANFTNSLKREIESTETALKAVIAAHPLAARLRKLKETLALYEAPVPSAPPTPQVPPSTEPAKPRRYEDMRVAARTFVEAHGGQFVPRSELLERLVTMGYLANSRRPMKVLAPLLSEWDEFESNRKGGWRLSPPKNPMTNGASIEGITAEYSEPVRAGILI